MDRKTFIRKTSAGILIGIPAIGLLGCSGSDDGGAPDPGPPDPGPGNGTSGNCLQNGTSTSISANHGHSLTVSKADVEAAVEKTYTLSQGSGAYEEHIHEITISASQFETLQDNDQITITSTSDASHTHSVTVSCA